MACLPLPHREHSTCQKELKNPGWLDRHDCWWRSFRISPRYDPSRRRPDSRPADRSACPSVRPAALGAGRTFEARSPPPYATHSTAKLRVCRHPCGSLPEAASRRVWGAAPRPGRRHSPPLPYSRPRVAPVRHAPTGSFMDVFGWGAGPQRPPRAADRRRGRPTRAAAPRVWLETSANPAPGTVRLMRCAPCGGLGRATGVACQAKLDPRLGGDARRASSNVEFD